MNLKCVSLALALLLGLSGCNSAEQKQENSPPTPSANVRFAEELSISTNQDPTSLDPHAADENCANRMFRLLYSTLLTLDSHTGKITPELAESYEQLSDTRLEFSLKRGVLFHNGDELTAKDVKFSLDRAKNSPRVKAQLSAIKEVVIIDDYTVQLILFEPSKPLLAKLCMTGTSILSERATTENKEFLPIGSGAYKFVDWEKGESITLERFDSYYAGISPTKRLIMRCIPDDSDRMYALERGKIQVAEWLESRDYGKVVYNPTLKLLETPSVTVAYLGFNMTTAPFDNKMVRQALAHAINKEELVREKLLGNGKMANTVFGPGVWGYYDNMPGFNYDPNKSRQMLRRAGYPQGFTMTVMSAGASFDSSSDILVKNFADVGVNLVVEEMESQAYFDDINNGRQQSHLGTWNNVILDPDRSVDPFHSGNFGAASNRMLYKNQRVDKLIEDGRREMDEEKRLKIYHELQEIIVDDCVWIPLYNINTAMAMAKDIGGVDINSANNPDYSTVYMVIQ